MSDILHSLDAGKERWYEGTVHRLFIDFKDACDSVRREVLLFIILIEFGKVVPVLN
jgi:hypothetical protein